MGMCLCGDLSCRNVSFTNLGALVFGAYLLSIKMSAVWWWFRPLIPAFGRQRQDDLSEFEANVVYKMSSRTARIVTQKNPVLRRKKKN